MSPRLATLFLLSALSTCAQAQTDYPKIDKTLQKARDEDRRLIFENELQAEREALAKAKAGDDALEVHRHTENIKALKRELSAIGAETTTPPGFRHDETAPILVRTVRTPAAAVPVPRASKTEPRGPSWDPYTRDGGGPGDTTAERRDSP